MIVRAACAADLERLLEVHMSVFPDPRGIEARRRNFEQNALGDYSDLRVVEDEGRVIAHAFLFPLEAWFGGRAMRAGGIASVGVAPEARGRGVATFLIDALHAESNARGDVLTILFAFREAFYARLGYAKVTPTRRITFTPRAVPRVWTPAGVRVAEARDRPAIEAAYLRAAARTTGWITRPPRMWDRAFLDERRRFFVAPRGAGFLSFTVSQPEAHAATTLTVHDLVADDEEARRALLGLIGAQRDQVAEAILDLDADDPLDRALLDPDGARHGTAEVEHAEGQLVAGPMVRAADVARALGERGATLSVEVDGERYGTAMGLRGPPSLRASAPPNGEPDLIMDRLGLAAIAFGGLAPSDAARLGWLRAREASALERADHAFALPPYFAIDRF
jgi:predicted acetyltransferase